MEPAAAVRSLYEAYQDRAWERARALLHPDAIVDMPATAERLSGRDVIVAFEEGYPEPWGVMTVHRVFGDANGAAAEVTVNALDGGRRFALGAFWRVEEGLLHYGVEYWVTAGGDAPPASRASSAQTLAARAAWDASLRR